jgi:diguanylate cyclase (GGDEF)-like protein/PAS domain S-box-containing protein
MARPLTAGNPITEGLFLAGAYVLAGKLGLLLALPPGYASPIFPPAGIALAFALLRGKAALPWILLGSLLLNLWVSLGPGRSLSALGIAAAAAIALASTLQAAIGGIAMRRLTGRVASFDHSREVWSILALAPLVSLVSASLSEGSLLALGLTAPQDFAVAWLSWWLGDALGMIVCLPLTLLFIGEPAGLWRARRLTVGLPMLLALALCVLIYTRTTRWEQDQVLHDFQLRSLDLAGQVQTRFEQQEFLVEQLAAFLSHREHPPVSRADFARFAEGTLHRYPMLQAIEWAPRVGAGERAAFEAAQQAELPGFQVRERDARGELRVAGTRDEYYPVSFLAPLEPNRAAVGFDLASAPARRRALQAALLRRVPVASAPLHLVQDPTHQSGALLLLPVLAGAQVRGVVLTALRFGDFVEEGVAVDRALFDIELVDLADASTVYGGLPPAHDGDARFERRLQFGTRSYALRTAPSGAYLAQHRGWQSLQMLAAGLFGTGLLGALLLLSTGTAARAEVLVLQRTADLERESRKNQLLLRNSSDGIHILDQDGNVIEASESFCRMLGYRRAEVIGMNVAQWDAQFSPAQLRQRMDERLGTTEGSVFETRHRRKDGTVFNVEVTACTIELAGRRVLFTSSRDVTERKTAEERILNLAYYDSLTQLPNRRLFVDRLRHGLAASARNREFGALVMLDLDHFKRLNDTRGHDLGDRLLVSVASRLVAVVREEDTICRLGGDEFLILLEGLSPQQDQAAGLAEQIAEKIREHLGRPYALAGGEADYRNSASIGLTLFRGHDTSIEALFKQADVALYQAKDAGRDTIRFFSPAMQAAIDARIALEAALRLALERDEFRVHFQPQVDHAGRCVGAEALVRWQHPQRGLVPPGEFIPLAEETGLIVEIGQRVLDLSCAQLRRWSADPVQRGLQVSVNISARQFHQPDFVERIQASLVAHGADPTHLVLELTESVVLDDVEEVARRMERLHALGVSFAMDDFGTGYSSLSYLKRLPLDQIKIDQSFVRDLTVDPSDAVIVQAILALSASLGLQAIAEGVETEEQHAFLLRHGCRIFQGYLFGRPVPIEEWQRAVALRSS